jgi:guanylate kinase
MSTQGKLVIFSAPSGSGKTTLMRAIMERGLNLAFSISACTRAPRGQEVHGQDYYFLSVEDFKQKIAGDAFLEYEEVYKDNFYGTLKSEVERLWAAGKHVIFDIDVVGGVNLKQQFGEKALSVFVQAPSVAVLKERLISRNTDSEEALQVRLAKAEEEMTFAVQFDAVVVNDDLEKAKEETYNLVANFLNA